MNKKQDINNKNDDDFEIIDEVPNDYIDDTVKTNNNKENNIKEEEDHNKKMHNFIVKILTIIFDSRDKKKEFSTKSRKKLTDSFSFGIEELIEYDDIKPCDESDGDKKKKYIIDFFLYKNNPENNESTQSAKTNDNDNGKLLVERWTIKYKENKIKGNNTYFENKMKIIEKSIITYSRILPLYKYRKDKSYKIAFEFDTNKKKNFKNEKSTKKIQLIHKDIFSFNLSIRYLELKPDNIEKLLHKKSFDFDFEIIESKKARKRFLSDDYTKKSSKHLLKDLGQKDKKDNLKKKESSSDEELSLVISETEDDIGHIKNQRKKTSDDNKKDDEKEEELILRKYQTEDNLKNFIYKGNENNDKLKNFNCKNKVVKDIIKEYTILRNMMYLMTNYDKINYNKLLMFISSN